MIHKFRAVFFGLLFLSVFLNSCKTSKVSSFDHFSANKIEDFFTRVSTSDYIGALDSLLVSNQFIDFTDSATIKLRESFKTINELSGQYFGHTLLKKRVIHDDISIYSYLAKYEKKFYRFVFIFYKRGNHVNIYKFSFDDEISLELEESIKLYVQ
jgi:hypothetical protein